MSDRAIRSLTAAAVLLVAAIAAVVSFVHIEHLAARHGQTTLAAYLLPLSIDGTVAAASLTMLRAARAGLGTPSLARFMLGLAVLATLACNVGYGAPRGVAGALLSGWPAVAFIGCTEMAVGAIRRTRPAPAAVPASAPVPAPEVQPAPAADSPVPAGSNGHEPAARVFAAELAAGDVPSIRQIRARMHVGQPRAKQIQAQLEALTPAGQSIAAIRNEMRTRGMS